ncbi:MAG: stage II sporulation protein M [Clostridiaceae bacterium]
MVDIRNIIEDNIRNNKAAYLITFLFFSIGIVLGAYTVKYMGSDSRIGLNNYFIAFVSSIGEKAIDYRKIFFFSLKNNIFLFGVIGIFGIFLFGFIVVLLANLLKGYVVGFTFSYLLTTYGYKGIGLALAAVIPQNIVIIPAMLLFSIIFINRSFRNILIMKNKSKKFSPEIKNLGNILIFFSILLVIGIFVETFISPNLIKFIITKFYG